DANTGTIEIGTHGTFDVGGSVGTSQVLMFTDPTGVLKLRQPISFAATIDSFVIGDTIDLPGVTASAAAWSPGTLAVSNAGTTLFDLAISGDETGLVFSAASDGTGGSAITANLPCFADGTLISTANGDRPVESLRAGELVRVVDDRYRPVTWIGHRRVDCRSHPNSRQVWPVRVAAGAFGIRQPYRDLYLSPDHAI